MDKHNFFCGGGVGAEGRGWVLERSIAGSGNFLVEVTETGEQRAPQSSPVHKGEVKPGTSLDEDPKTGHGRKRSSSRKPSHADI